MPYEVNLPEGSIMYKCQECGKSSELRQAKLANIQYRADGSISKEVAVCIECYTGEDKQEIVDAHFAKEVNETMSSSPKSVSVAVAWTEEEDKPTEEEVKN